MMTERSTKPIPSKKMGWWGFWQAMRLTGKTQLHEYAVCGWVA
jgi:hypothetical protein